MAHSPEFKGKKAVDKVTKGGGVKSMAGNSKAK